VTMASSLLQKQASGMAFKSSMVPHKARFAQTQLATRVQRRTVQVNARQNEVDVGLFGTKAGMMSWFTADGLCVPATVIALEPGNIVTALKTEDTDGYNAVQVGYKVIPERKITKPEYGHLLKAGVPPLKHLREFKVHTRAAPCM
jgi:large subunit ribosomal protein L3